MDERPQFAAYATGRMMAALLATSLLGIVAGCQKFNGNVGFQNATNGEIWVDRVEGFKRRPPCGRLSSHARADSSMGSMDAPNEITIHWSHEIGGADNESVVSLKDSGLPKDDDEFLLFVYQGNGEWKAMVDKYNFNVLAMGLNPSPSGESFRFFVLL